MCRVLVARIEGDPGYGRFLVTDPLAQQGRPAETGRGREEAVSFLPKTVFDRSTMYGRDTNSGLRKETRSLLVSAAWAISHSPARIRTRLRCIYRLLRFYHMIGDWASVGRLPLCSLDKKRGLGYNGAPRITFCELRQCPSSNGEFGDAWQRTLEDQRPGAASSESRTLVDRNRFDATNIADDIATVVTLR